MRRPMRPRPGVERCRTTQGCRACVPAGSRPVPNRSKPASSGRSLPGSEPARAGGGLVQRAAESRPTTIAPSAFWRAYDHRDQEQPWPRRAAASSAGSRRQAASRNAGARPSRHRLAEMGQTQQVEDWATRAITIGPDDHLVQDNVACARSCWQCRRRCHRSGKRLRRVAVLPPRPAGWLADDGDFDPCAATRAPGSDRRPPWSTMRMPLVTVRPSRYRPSSISLVIPSRNIRRRNDRGHRPILEVSSLSSPRATACRPSRGGSPHAEAGPTHRGLRAEGAVRKEVLRAHQCAPRRRRDGDHLWATATTGASTTSSPCRTRSRTPSSTRCA